MNRFFLLISTLPLTILMACGGKALLGTYDDAGHAVDTGDAGGQRQPEAGPQSSDGGTGGGASMGDATGEARASVTLAVRTGRYTSCMAFTDTVGNNPPTSGVQLSSANGGEGTFTLAAGDDGVLTGTLAFGQGGGGVSVGPPSVGGEVSFVPTSSRSAAFAPGRTFDVQAVNVVHPDATVTVTTTAGSLMLVGDQLFVSLYGATTGDASGDGVYTFSAFVRCPVPSSLDVTTITGSVSTTPVHVGTFGVCSVNMGGFTTSDTIGGVASVAVTESGGTLTATWQPGYPDDVFDSLAFTATSGSTAILNAGQTSVVDQPCGPPPSLGPSHNPTTAKLTNFAGGMAVDGDSLFVNLLGDTTPQACGPHYVSVICAGRSP